MLGGGSSVGVPGPTVGAGVLETIGIGVRVAVAKRVADGIKVAVGNGVNDAAKVAVGTGVLVGRGVGLATDKGVRVAGTPVLVAIGVRVAVDVDVDVGAIVLVGTDVLVGAGVFVGIGVAVGKNAVLHWARDGVAPVPVIETDFTVDDPPPSATGVRPDTRASTITKLVFNDPENE